MPSEPHAHTGDLNLCRNRGNCGHRPHAPSRGNTWQTHYDDPKRNHYDWFVPDTVTGPAPNGTDGKHGAVVVKSRRVTADEKKLCAGDSARDKVLTRGR